MSPRAWTVLVVTAALVVAAAGVVGLGWSDLVRAKAEEVEPKAPEPVVEPDPLRLRERVTKCVAQFARKELSSEDIQKALNELQSKCFSKDERALRDEGVFRPITLGSDKRNGKDLVVQYASSGCVSPYFVRIVYSGISGDECCEHKAIPGRTGHECYPPEIAPKIADWQNPCEPSAAPKKQVKPVKCAEGDPMCAD
jgi:hypothetical protein